MNDLQPTEVEREALTRVIDHACALAEQKALPVFAAAVVIDGEVIALSGNQVSETCDPSRHAEVVAISEAAMALGRADLSGATLVASMQPCEMCLAAMRWAGIDRLVFAETQERAPKFFQFPDLGIADFHRASGGDFSWAGGIGADRVAHIYEGGR
ncbi:cytosine deaminase [Roseivivax halodurans JCM 10272]|uniref:Cytosine deaminase n=1 Tax=Roseivivax halodurans JCM 10272 TaxID=1449350 RepID=X7EIK8_9RHOB|nr:nucleoside deaminase [Roseivivax halodurans]ETX15725.1 cytosine deaminase [Roseivivax halodurans JCM 10272]